MKPDFTIERRNSGMFLVSSNSPENVEFLKNETRTSYRAESNGSVFLTEWEIGRLATACEEAGKTVEHTTQRN